MAQSTQSQMKLQSWNRKPPTSIPLPSSKGSSLVSARQPSPPSESIERDFLPLVTINHSGTTPPPTLAKRPLPLLKPSILTSNLQPREATAQDFVFEKSVLIGLGFGSDLVIGKGGGGIDLGVKAEWQRRALDELSEDGSDLGLIDVSPIYATSSVTGPAEEKFVNATAHLRQHSDPATREEIFKASLRRAEKAVQVLEEEECEMRTSIERESSEEVMVVPDLRPGIESAVEARRRRRRLERRQTSLVGSKLVQR